MKFNIERQTRLTHRDVARYFSGLGSMEMCRLDYTEDEDGMWEKMALGVQLLASSCHIDSSLQYDENEQCPAQLKILIQHIANQRIEASENKTLITFNQITQPFEFYINALFSVYMKIHFRSVLYKILRSCHVMNENE